MNTSYRLIELPLYMGLLSTPVMYGQDTIILKNGFEIQTKVLEVSPGQINYRCQDNSDGPIYTPATTEELLIKYANGIKDIMNQPATRAPHMSTATMSLILSGTSHPTGATTLGRLVYNSGLFSRYFIDGAGERVATYKFHFHQV